MIVILATAWGRALRRSRLPWRGAFERLAMLGLLSFLYGATCAPAKPLPNATIIIDNIDTGKSFTTKVPFHQTHGWDREGLSPVTSDGSAKLLYKLQLTGEWPRELLVLDRSATEHPASCAPVAFGGTACAKVPAWQMTPVTFYPLPGVPTGFGKSIANSAAQKMVVQAARLIDHGACFQPVALAPIFEGLKDGILQGFQFAAWNNGDKAGLTASEFSAAYIREPGVTSSIFGNQDGFALHAKLRYEGSALGLFGFNFDTEVWQTYRVSIDPDGLPGISPIDTVGWDDRSNAASFFQSLAPVTGKTVGAFNELRKALQAEVPKTFHASARGVASQQLKVGEVVARCTPFLCGGEEADPKCVRVGRGFLETGLIGSGRKGSEAHAIAESLPAEEFGCAVADDAEEFSEVESKGVCTWTPKFKRVNVLPDHLELVWYDEGEVPPPEFEVAKALAPGGSGPSCPDSKSPTLTPQIIPVSAFDSPTIDLPQVCKSLRSCPKSCPRGDQRCINLPPVPLCPGNPCIGPNALPGCTQVN